MYLFIFIFLEIPLEKKVMKAMEFLFRKSAHIYISNHDFYLLSEDL